jgi:1-acyl-sn-glycerol-3-phosphate acyltransferase
MALLFSLVFWGFMLVTSMLLFPVAVVVRAATGPFDQRLRALHLFTCFWGSLYSWCNPFWTVRIEGKENFRPGETSVIVSNHQSLVDILVLFRLFVHYKWVSKAENFRIPFIGWNMRLNRYIRIDRGSMKGNLSMMRDGERALRQGNSLMIFPEGTRSPDGSLREFRPGAFELALKTGCPVLPLALRGTAAALPRSGFILRGRHAITITVLPPVRPALEGIGDASELGTRVRDAVAAALREGPEGPPIGHTGTPAPMAP